MPERDARAHALEAHLTGRRLGRRVVVCERVESTNDLAWELAGCAKEPPDGLVVLADTQTAGRGRVGRAWDSPAALGLYLSVYLRPGWPAMRAALLTLAAGLAAARACAASGVTPALKWPNDLVAPDGSGRKLGGILTETRSAGAEIAEAVVGIGINVGHGDQDFAPGLAGRAVSLALLGAPPRAPWRLAGDVVAALDDEVRGLDDPRGAAAVVARWRRASTVWGRQVSVEREGRVVHGLARDLADDGGLVVRLDSGAEIVVRAGDVSVAWTAG